MLADHLIESHIRLTYGRLTVHLVKARLIRQWWRWVRPHWRRQTRSWRSCIINHMLMMPIQSSVMYTCWLGACLRHVHWNHYGLIHWDQRQVICIYLRLTFRINIIIHLPYRTSNILYINSDLYSLQSLGQPTNTSIIPPGHCHQGTCAKYFVL